MARSITNILNSSDLSGMLLITDETGWLGMWLPLGGCRRKIAKRRNSNSGDALARAVVANR